MAEVMLPAKEENNTAAFDDLFREYFKPLCAYCQFRFGLDIDAAKDAVHSGFIKLLESSAGFSSKLFTRSYLYKAVTNICLDMARHEIIKQKHEQFVQKTSKTELGDDNKITEFKELQNDINTAISELPDQMRRIFELSRYEGMKYAEIALQLGISLKTVETQMSRALVKLRHKLASYLTMFWYLFIFLMG